MAKGMAIAETTKARPKEGLRMTIKAETSSVVAVKSIFRIPRYTHISNRSMTVSLLQGQPQVSIFLEEAEADLEKRLEIRVKTMKRWI